MATRSELEVIRHWSRIPARENAAFTSPSIYIAVMINRQHEGFRPTTSTEGPHRQLDQQASSELTASATVPGSTAAPEVG